MAYCDLEGDMGWAEQLVAYIVSRVLETSGEHFKVLERDTGRLEQVKAPFPRMSYSAAVEVLQGAGVDFEWGGDFGAPDETLLTMPYDRPIFVHHFPRDIKAAYHYRIQTPGKPGYLPYINRTGDIAPTMTDIYTNSRFHSNPRFSLI